MKSSFWGFFYLRGYMTVTVKTSVLPNGHTVRSTYVENDNGHTTNHSCDGKPALEYVSTTGEVYHQRWLDHGVLHRYEGPASVSFIDGVAAQRTFAVNGNILTEEYLQKNDLLKDDLSFKDEVYFGLTMGGFEWLLSSYPKD